MKILALHLQAYFDFAQVRGIPQELLIANMQSPPGDFSDPKALVSVSDFYNVLEELHRVLQDEQAGWRIGSFFNLKALGLIYEISLKTKTVEEALFYLQDFLKLTFPLVELKSSKDSGTHVLQLRIRTEKTFLNRIILECLLSIISRELKIMSNNNVTLKITSPFFKSTYPSHFVYGETYQLKFSYLNLREPVGHFDQAQLGYLIPAYLQLIEGLRVKTDFQSKVKVAALSMAKPELPGLPELANTFHLSPRTFQRKLASEKITFRELSDELKKQMASLLLRHQDYSITDIAWLLGYAEPASFIHSFNRWYNCSPSNMRTKRN